MSFAQGNEGVVLDIDSQTRYVYFVAKGGWNFVILDMNDGEVGEASAPYELGIGSFWTGKMPQRVVSAAVLHYRQSLDGPLAHFASPEAQAEARGMLRYLV